MTVGKMAVDEMSRCPEDCLPFYTSLSFFDTVVLCIRISFFHLNFNKVCF
jgi:hypothetical protein